MDCACLCNCDERTCSRMADSKRKKRGEKYRERRRRRILINTIYLIHFNIVSNLSIPENSLLNGETFNFSLLFFFIFFRFVRIFRKEEKAKPFKNYLSANIQLSWRRHFCLPSSYAIFIQMPE